MKKADIELVRFDSADVITTSSVPATTINTYRNSGFVDTPKLTSYSVVKNNGQLYVDVDHSGDYSVGDVPAPCFATESSICHASPYGYYICMNKNDHY